MEQNECEETECPPPGAPEWIMTFADLMSLMMCFFVLLLSFSEMDVLKFKQIAGSMKVAFGVQRDIKTAMDLPMGTSIIAQEFSPAQPQPTLINEIRQETASETDPFLMVKDPAIEDAKDKAEELKEALSEEISEGLLEISTIDDQVIIRIREKGSFQSASAQINAAFRAVLTKIADALNQVQGKILIAGHTDDIPIQTREFASNWVLSAARAAAVAHTMAEIGGIEPERIEIRAYAENRPLEPNTTTEGRATNRRVEIIVLGERSSKTLLENATDGATPPEAQEPPR